MKRRLDGSSVRPSPLSSVPDGRPYIGTIKLRELDEGVVTLGLAMTDVELS